MPCKMERYFFYLLYLLLGCSLCGCSRKQAPKQTQDPDTETTIPYADTIAAPVPPAPAKSRTARYPVNGGTSTASAGRRQRSDTGSSLNSHPQLVRKLKFAIALTRMTQMTRIFNILNLYYQRHLCLKNNQTESCEFMPHFVLFEITLHQNK